MELSAPHLRSLKVPATGDARGSSGGGRRRHSSSSSSASSASSGRSTSSRRRDAALNLPLDREFVPLTLEGDGKEEAEEDGDAAARDDVRDDVIRMIFDLPRATRFYQDFSCAVAATLAMHGRMYPTDSHVCFYSNVFGRERKILIPYESISQVSKTTTMVFQNAIRIATGGKDEFTFTSFWGNNRDACYDLIVKTRDRVVSELKPAVVRGLARPGSASSCSSSTGGGGGRRSAIEAHGATPSPVTSLLSGSSAKSGDGTVASPTQHEETDNADSDAESALMDASAPNLEVAVEQNEQSTALDRQAADAEAEESDLHAPVRRSSVVSDVGSVAPKDISMTQILEASFDVSVDEFMAEFIWDGARFGTDTYGVSQGYTEMECNAWMSPMGDDASFGMTRSLQFRVSVDAPIGPKSSRVDVLQCAKIGENNVRVIETSTRLVDIPYGDYFSVEDRWTIVPSKANPKRCKLFIELKVVFSKSTIWKGKIESRAIADNKIKWLGWSQAAKQHLADQQKLSAAPVSASPPLSSESAVVQTSVDTEHLLPHCRSPPAAQSSTSSTRATASKRRSSRASASHKTRSAQAAGPSPSFILYLRVFPWILVLGLLFLVVRMQSSLTNIEQTLVLASAKVDAIESRLAALSAACPAPGA